MSDAPSDRFQAARDWFERAHADGWLDAADLERMERLERAAPSDLFTQAQRRPLVVAFFGGTGVGKSSLLNRLAGEPIAHTGVERPTSREVTLYIHDSVELALLPEAFPLERVQVRRHHDDRNREILWIDMPDIDSTHRANRKLALAWLSHIDLLIYVVSPERYRDDAGWRVLRQRGGRHGWMFVMNRIDEGDRAQADDFRRLLREGGFDHPVLARTCCEPTRAAVPQDEFERIPETIQSLLEAHAVEELERLGHRARLRELRAVLTAAVKRLGEESQWEALRARWAGIWERTRDALRDGVEPTLQMLAAQFAARPSGVVRQIVGAVAKTGAAPRGRDDETDRPADPSQPSVSLPVAELWDSWMRDRLAEGLDAVEVQVRRTGAPAEPLRARLDAAAAQAGQTVQRHAGRELRHSLARPGTFLQRAAREVMRFFMLVLPTLALLWVGYHVVVAYFHASRGTTEYLGLNFAIHSMLLIGVAWGLPFLLGHLLKPSLEQSALRGLRRGMDEALHAVHAELDLALEDALRRRTEIAEEGTRLVREIAALELRPIHAEREPLARVLASGVAR